MKREFNKYLKSLTDKELVKELQKLYTKFDNVKQYYQLELGTDSKAVLDQFKARVKKEYFPSRGYGEARNSVSRKVVTEFKKISIHPKDIVDLLLYRVEMMLDFTLSYGDMDEAFYNSLYKSFAEACKHIKKEQLEVHYKAPCATLVNKASPLGWGIYFDLRDEFKDCFGTYAGD